MYSIVLTLCLAAVAQGFTFRDCGGADSALVFKELNVSPSPVVFPGDVSLTFNAESLDTIENFNIVFDIKKYLIGIPLPVPCVNGFGSCAYEDICGLLEGDSEIANVIRQILEAAGLPSSCPLPPGEINVPKITVPLPTLPSEIAPLIVGRYKIQTDISENGSNRALGCVEIDFEIEASSYNSIYRLK